MSAAFLLTTFVIVATAGTGVLYTLAAGLARGPRTSVVAACGCTLGVVPHMVAAITGLAAIMHERGCLSGPEVPRCGVPACHGLADRARQQCAHSGRDG